MPGYRPPSSEPRGKWAKRIHEKRRELGMSQQRAFELLGERLEFGPKSRAAYVALDMGTRQPTEPEAAILAEWLGGYPSEEDPIMAGSGGTTELPAALIKALQDQTDAITRLADQVKALVAMQPAPTELATAMVELVRSGLLAGSPAEARAAGLPRK